MRLRLTAPRLSTATLATLMVCTSTSGVAQDDDPAPMFAAGKRPFVYAMIASPNRLKDEATYMFDVAGMPEAVDGVMKTLEDNAEGLAGLDWDRPVGMMVYLNSVFPPSFEFVSFLPVGEMQDFQTMMELSGGILREEPNEAGRYELITQRRNVQMRIENGYAFIQMPFMDPDPTFDRDLPSPSSLVASLSNQFDIGITLDVEAVPQATRTLLLNVLNSTMSTQIQQRDEEADSTYELRKSWMQADIDGMKLLFDECQKISIGLNVDSDNRLANVDFVIDVKDGGELLEEILASSSIASYFSPLLSDDAPISLSWSGIMADRDVQRYTEALEALKGEAARVIEEDGELGDVPREGGPLFAALSGLQETIRDGHIDMFGQMYRDTVDKIAVVGALRIEDGDAIGSGLGDFLNRIRDKADFGELTLGFKEHAGVSFHRLEFRDVDAGGREIFGNGAGVVVGCGPRTMWVCVGGDKSFDVLTGTMDELVAAYENPTEQRLASAMRVVVQVNEMINLVTSAEQANRATVEELEVKTEQPNVSPKPAETKKFGNEREKRISQFRERRQRGRQAFADALAEGDDRVELNFRPTDKGMRMRASFQEGFIRGFGRMIGSRFVGN